MHGTFDVPVPRTVGELIEVAANGATAHPLRFDGLQGTKSDYERLLRQTEKKLARIVEQYPREKGERLKHYVDRLFGDTPQGRDHAKLLERAVSAVANIRRIDADKDELAELRANADLAEYRDNAKRLLSTIADAIEGEQLLAKLFAALNAHTAAQQARGELALLFSKASTAASQLSKDAPVRPKFNKSPDGVAEMAALLRYARKS